MFHLLIGSLLAVASPQTGPTIASMELDQCVGAVEMQQRMVAEGMAIAFSTGLTGPDAPRLAYVLNGDLSYGYLISSTDGKSFCKLSLLTRISLFRMTGPLPRDVEVTALAAPAVFANAEVRRYADKGYRPLASFWVYRADEKYGERSVVMATSITSGSATYTINSLKSGAASKTPGLAGVLRVVNPDIASAVMEPPKIAAAPAPPPRPAWCTQKVALGEQKTATGADIDWQISFYSTPKGVDLFTKEWRKETGKSQAAAVAALADYVRYLKIARRLNSGRDEPQCL